jgi:hypothetical protein
MMVFMRAAMLASACMMAMIPARSASSAEALNKRTWDYCPMNVESNHGAFPATLAQFRAPNCCGQCTIGNRYGCLFTGSDGRQWCSPC